MIVYIWVLRVCVDQVVILVVLYVVFFICEIVVQGIFFVGVFYLVFFFDIDF